MPLDEQDILGHQITDAHIVTFTIPQELVQAGFSAITSIRPTQKFDEASELFTITGSYKPDFERDERKPMVLCQPWGIRGRVLHIADAATQQQTGEVLTVRLSTIWGEARQRAAVNAFFAEALRRTKAEIDDRKRREREAAERARLQNAKESQRQKTITLNQRKIETFRDRALKPAYPIALSIALMLAVPFLGITAQVLGANPYGFFQKGVTHIYNFLNGSTSMFSKWSIWYIFNSLIYVSSTYYVVVILWLTRLRLENWKNLLESSRLEISQKEQVNRTNISAIERFCYQPWFIGLKLILLYFLGYSFLVLTGLFSYKSGFFERIFYTAITFSFPILFMYLPAYWFGFNKLLKHIETSLNEWMPNNHQPPPDETQKLIGN